jgi:taurine dioxygenase
LHGQKHPWGRAGHKHEFVGTAGIVTTSEAFHSLTAGLRRGTALLTVSRLTPFGAAVDGIDIESGVSEDDTRFLIHLLYRHRVLIVRGQERLSLERYAQFGGEWGEPIIFYRAGDRHKELPSLIRISNSPTVAENMRNAAMHWHSDSTYEPTPASVTTLYAVEAPSAGNATLFVDTAAVYASLSEDLRLRIEDLTVIHHVRSQKVDGPDEHRASGTELDASAPPTVRHPLVIKHPATGQRGLFGFAGTAYGIEGMPDEEAIPLLIDIKREATLPQLRLSASAEAGTILMWDNYAVVHCATLTRYSDADGERRLLYRISTRGKPRLAYDSGDALSNIGKAAQR